MASTSLNKDDHINTKSHFDNIHTSDNTITDLPVGFKGTSQPMSLSLPSAKDEGYSWVVMMVGCLIHVLSAGWSRTFPLVMLAVQEDFDDYSTGAAGLVMGLMWGFNALLVPVCSWFIGRFGHRACGICGALTISSGLLLATQASTMMEMAIPLGAMGGIGLSMVNLPGAFLITQYFDKRRATANGVRMAGMPLGGMLLPFIFLACRTTLGLKCSFIIFAGLILNIAVFASMYRSFEVQRNLVHRRYLRNLIDDVEVRNNLLVTELGQISKVRSKKKGLQWSLLQNQVFAVHLLAAVFFAGALPVGMTFRQIYARSIGVSSLDITTVAAVQALFEFMYRPVIGGLADRKIFRKWKGLLAGMCFYGLITGMVPFIWDFWSLIVVTLLQTCGSSLYVTLAMIVIADLWGEDMFPTAWGFYRSIQGCCHFIYPVLIGLVSDATGSMAVAFYLMGSMGVLATLIMLLQPFVNKRAGLKIKFR
ncbi:unnamed protein product [Meganyctiphanes norvegica]|uniref:Major facilitator superfamily (MFS) profile domain-containing protein n=1 Tax=Meganyctiphanes norvegica TaxID=48144 RepID=A0AAV2PQD0_MEGNR